MRGIIFLKRRKCKTKINKYAKKKDQNSKWEIQIKRRKNLFIFQILNNKYINMIQTKLKSNHWIITLTKILNNTIKLNFYNRILKRILCNTLTKRTLCIWILKMTLRNIKKNNPIPEKILWSQMFRKILCYKTFKKILYFKIFKKTLCNKTIIKNVYYRILKINSTLLKALNFKQ